MTENKLFLTGSDCFYNAIVNHIKNGHSSNTHCQIIFGLSSLVPTDEIEKAILNNQHVQFLNRIDGIAKKVGAPPFWRLGNKQQIIVEASSTSHEKLTDFTNDLDTEKSKEWMKFSIFQNENTQQTFIRFDWHHLIMDGMGAELLLRSIFKDDEICILDKNEKKTPIKEFFKGKKFVGKYQKEDSLSVFLKEGESKNICTSIRFSSEEKKEIEERAQGVYPLAGRFFYIFSCISHALKQELNWNDEGTLWVSVPHNMRKIGSVGPILGNHNSFMFFKYSLTEDKLTLAKTLHHQAQDQLKNNKPKYVASLMRYMRYLGEEFVAKKVPHKNGHLGSFLITQAKNNTFGGDTKWGNSIVEVLNIPPNPNNPGLTFSIHDIKDELVIVIQHKPENTHSIDLESLKKRIKFVLST